MQFQPAFSPTQLIIAGWTGRDEAALKKHIKELEEIGVKPPKTTPIFYRVSASLFCHADAIQVSGPDTSGEVEFVLIQGDELCVALGSDHTDRKAETMGVSLSKQLVAKGGIRPAKSFRMELDDPVRKKKLTHEYRLDVLPVEG